MFQNEYVSTWQNYTSSDKRIPDCHCPMPIRSNDAPSPRQRLEEERTAYLNELPTPNPDWPADVRAIMDGVNEHLFEPDLRVRDVREQCGCYNNNISAHFEYYVGMGIKAYIAHRRLALAKRLLQQTNVPIKYIAWTVGYETPSAFSTIFKRWTGCTPTEFRKKSRDC